MGDNGEARREREEYGRRLRALARLEGPVRRYELARTTPGAVRDAATAVLEAELQRHGQPVRVGDWIYLWSRAAGSIQRMPAAVRR